jgi:hypothetical protein
LWTLFVDRLFRFVEQLDELANAPLVDEALLFAFAPLVGKLDDQPRVQERKLAQTAGEQIETVLGGREDLGIGLEGDLRTRAIGVADGSDGPLRNSPPVLLVPDVPFAPNLHFEPLGDGIDGAHSDAMEPG